MRSSAATCTTTCRRGCSRGCAEPFGEVTDEMLEQAKHNLRDDIVYFGLTERFDESLVLAKRRLGFRSILYRPLPAAGAIAPQADPPVV